MQHTVGRVGFVVIVRPLWLVEVESWAKNFQSIHFPVLCTEGTECMLGESKHGSVPPPCIMAILMFLGCFKLSKAPSIQMSLLLSALRSQVPTLGWTPGVQRCSL